MFDILFGWTKASKCKKAIKRARCRLIQLKNKRQTIAMHLRNDLAELIFNGHQQIAIQRVEKLIQDESLIAAYEILDHLFDLVLKQLWYIRKHKDCPTDINEAISSLIFASSRFGDFPELYPIRKIFAHCYGNDFETAAVDLLPGNLVNTTLKENLSVTFVPYELKYRVVDVIARECALQTKLKEYKGNQLIESDAQIIQSKIHFSSEIDQEIETDVTGVSLDLDIDECNDFSSKDGCGKEQKLVLFNSSDESNMNQDESSSESSIWRKRASKKRLRRKRTPLLAKQGIIEIGYTLHYQTPSPQSSYPKKRLKQHSYSDSCRSELEGSERNSLDFNMSECSCNLNSPCYCSVYNEIEMFEYLGTSSSSTNVFNPINCAPYSRALIVSSKFLENYNDDSLTAFSSSSPRPKHVHPKLPNYEEFVATFMALKRERKKESNLN